MKPSPTSVIVFEDCDTDEEIKRHLKGVESRRKRKEAKHRSKAEAIMERREMTDDEKSADYIHNLAVFDFWWRGDESQLKAIVEDAIRNKDDDFAKSISAFALYLALRMPGAVPGPLPSFTYKTPMKALDFILQLRGTAVKPSFDAFYFHDRNNYDPDRPEMEMMRNFRKTRTFTNGVFGVDYDSSHSDIHTVSPALKALRVAEEAACGDGTEDTAMVIFRFLYKGHKSGETDSSQHSESSDVLSESSSGVHSDESDREPISDSDKKPRASQRKRESGAGKPAAKTNTEEGSVMKPRASQRKMESAARKPATKTNTEEGSVMKTRASQRKRKSARAAKRQKQDEEPPGYGMGGY